MTLKVRDAFPVRYSELCLVSREKMHSLQMLARKREYCEWQCALNLIKEREKEKCDCKQLKEKLITPSFKNNRARIGAIIHLWSETWLGGRK